MAKTIRLTERHLTEMVRNEIRTVLNEYHHANDDGDIQKKCEDTARYMIDNYGEILHNGRTNPKDDFILYVRICKEIPDDCYFDPNTQTVHVGYNALLRCAKDNDVRRLASFLYHELGHKTNFVKSDRQSQIKADIKPPLMISFDDEIYKAYAKVLYRFNMREMKARCFEATMFLKQSDMLPTLEEYYGDRCTDITMMRQFIEHIRQMTYNPDGRDEEIIDQLFHVLNKQPSFRRKVSREEKGEKLIKFFTKKYMWFKKRVDKIYSDFKQQQCS